MCTPACLLCINRDISVWRGVLSHQAQSLQRCMGQEVGWCLRGQVFLCVHVSPGPGESLERRGWWRRNARPTLEITRVRGQGGDGAVLSWKPLGRLEWEQRGLCRKTSTQGPLLCSGGLLLHPPESGRSEALLSATPAHMHSS